MENVIYLITRNDGKQYVGITCQFNRRMSAHKRTDRFKDEIKNIEILRECETYEEAERLEPDYIKKYNTFYDGLNKSIDGKGNHLAPNFNTKGYKFTEEQRENMRKNHWSKRMKNTWTNPKNYSEETRNSLSKKRKGKCWCPRKIPREAALEFIHSYENDLIKFDSDFIKQFVKVTHKDQVGNLSLEELKTPNGKHLNKLKLYSEYFYKEYGKEYGATVAAIRSILTKGVAEDYENSK